MKMQEWRCDTARPAYPTGDAGSGIQCVTGLADTLGSHPESPL